MICLHVCLHLVCRPHWSPRCLCSILSAGMRDATCPDGWLAASSIPLCVCVWMYVVGPQRTLFVNATYTIEGKNAGGRVVGNRQTQGAGCERHTYTCVRVSCVGVWVPCRCLWRPATRCRTNSESSGRPAGRFGDKRATLGMMRSMRVHASHPPACLSLCVTVHQSHQGRSPPGSVDNPFDGGWDAGGHKLTNATRLMHGMDPLTHACIHTCCMHTAGGGKPSQPGRQGGR